MKKSIELTRQQYRNLLLSVIIGTYIREAVAELEGGNLSEVTDFEAYLLSFAKNFDCEDMVEDLEGYLVPSDKICREYHDKIIEKYNDDEFWNRLIIDLGQRDFYRTMTLEEKKIIEKENRLPKRVHEIYKWYEKELEDNGLENVKIIRRDEQN